MSNRGWEESGNGGETMASTERTTGVSTQTGAAEPFLRPSMIAHPDTAQPDTMSGRGDLFEPPGQMSVDH
jgi:hypothetical protein